MQAYAEVFLHTLQAYGGVFSHTLQAYAEIFLHNLQTRAGVLFGLRQYVCYNLLPLLAIHRPASIRVMFEQNL